jgi:acetolactate synthase-1/2/3 large subunit
MATVSAHVAHAIADHISDVFGLMGNGNAYFLDAIEQQTEARFTAVRHEQGSVLAADAYYRASGRIAAATTTYGPGFTNTLTALAEAAQAQTPLVLVVGDAPTTGHRPWDVDQTGLATAVGVQTFTVGEADAAATTIHAIERALHHRTPVVLAIPYDLAAREAGALPEATEVRHSKLIAPTGPAAEAVLDEIASALGGAKHPLLLAGRGAWLSGAGEALGALADATGALTASTALGRGVFPAAEFDLGVTGGFGAPGAMELFHQADVVVVFGAGLNQFTMRFGELLATETRVFQVDIKTTPTHARVDGYLLADARLAAEALIERMASETVHTPWRERVDVASAKRYDLGSEFGPDGRLDPRAAAARLAELLPQDRVVVSDGGHFIGWANMYWPVASPDRMIMVGTAFQTIGIGWPSVVGAALARPEQTIVLTSGDGGGLMALADLESAVRVAGGQGMAVVWNDAAYGAEINLYGIKGLDKGPMLIPEVNFAALAEAVGAEGVIARSLADLERVGQWANEDATSRRFLLVDLRICGTIISPYQEEVIRINS